MHQLANIHNGISRNEMLAAVFGSNHSIWTKPESSNAATKKIKISIKPTKKRLVFVDFKLFISYFALLLER